LKSEKEIAASKEQDKYLDYKDPEFLKKFLNEQARFCHAELPNLAEVPEKVAFAVKRARHLALLPYVADLLK
jgi:small subunit ribosomal protein S18